MMKKQRHSCCTPIRLDRTGHPLCSAFNELSHEQAGGIHRPRHYDVSLVTAFEPGFAVIGLIAYQQDELMAARLRLSERSLDQSISDPALAEGWLDGERTEQQRLCRADPDRGEPHRAHEQALDPGRE